MVRGEVRQKERKEERNKERKEEGVGRQAGRFYALVRVGGLIGFLLEFGSMMILLWTFAAGPLGAATEFSLSHKLRFKFCAFPREVVRIL